MKTILVADDDSMIRLLFAEILTDAGYHVVFAKCGYETLAKVRHRLLDLVILDVKMPDIHGLDVS